MGTGTGEGKGAVSADGEVSGDEDVAGASTTIRQIRRTRRWRGVVAIVLAAVAIGVLAKRPSLLLVAAVGVAFAAYPSVATAPTPDLRLRREVSPESPEHGDAVHVTTTLHNAGDETIYDCRVVDGVPAMLAVDDGSPRRGTTLRPGEETTVSYAVGARRGRHRFRPATVLARDLSGTMEVEATVEADEETTVECAARVPAVPLRSRSRHRTGRLVTDSAGGGVEFHRVSTYERGDPANRIDWRRFARTGELTSVEFRAERLADVVICVDARAEAYRAAGPDEPHAVAYAVDAAERLADALLDGDQRVGLAAIGRSACWVAPGSGRAHRDRLRRRLATDPVFSPMPPDAEAETETETETKAQAETEAETKAQAETEAETETGGGTRDPDRVGRRGRERDGRGAVVEPEPIDRQLATVRSRLGSNAQVLLLSPLCDDGATNLAQRLEAAGPAVTVVSPDVTTDDTVGARLARVERDGRLTALRNAGVPAVDWQPESRLGAALVALERWDG